MNCLFLLSVHSEHLNLLGGVDILAKICLLLKKRHIFVVFSPGSP